MRDKPRRRRFAAASTRSRITLDLETHAALLDAIAANRDDIAAWMVLADQLQTIGHPRGELISLMVEREQQASRRLFEAQRALLSTHVEALLPAELDREAVVGWRRGFASELRLDKPEQLAAISSDRSLRFVDAATLVIDDDSAAAWSATLENVRLPWRQLRVEANVAEPLDVSALLASCPELVMLRVALSPAGTVTWNRARSEALRVLVLVDAGDVRAPDDVHLPNLVELRVLGDTFATDELRVSALWNRLERVLIDEGAPDEGPYDETEETDDGANDDDDDHDGEHAGPTMRFVAPIAHPILTTWDDDDEYDRPEPPRTTAVVVIGADVDIAVLRKLAASLSGGHLSARFTTVRTPHPLSVLQLFGLPGDADLQPYSFACALASVLDGKPPIVLFELDEQQTAARYLVVGEPPVRGTQKGAFATVRRILDLALGRDLGLAVVEDLLDELRAAPRRRLGGDGGFIHLAAIDPSTAPLVVEDDTEYSEPDDEDHYDDGDEEEYWDEPEGYDYERMQYDGPVLADVVEEMTESATAAAAPAPNAMSLEPAIDDAPASDELVIDDSASFVNDAEIYEAVVRQSEDALVAPPERSELWFEFRDHWSDRAVDANEEPTDSRWPDPERAASDVLDLDRQIAEPTCAEHALALEHCGWCGALHCAECVGDEPSCIGVLVDGRSVAVAILPSPRIEP